MSEEELRTLDVLIGRYVAKHAASDAVVRSAVALRHAVRRVLGKRRG